MLGFLHLNSKKRAPLSIRKRSQNFFLRSLKRKDYYLKRIYFNVLTSADSLTKLNATSAAAANDGMGPFDPEEVFFVVQGEMEYGNQVGQDEEE